MDFLILPGIGVFVLLILGATLISRYKTCPSNAILVVYGNTKGGRAATCVHGGGKFVMPVIQQYSFLKLTPMVLDINLTGALSQENIRVDVPTTVTVAISADESASQNAAKRLLEMNDQQIRGQAEDIVLGQMRGVIATMTIEQLNRDRTEFMVKVNEAIAEELAKIGMELVNVNIKDIGDESGYIEAQGRKAAAEAINQASIDVAEQEKLGEIGVADRNAEKRAKTAQLNADAEIAEREAEKTKKIRLAELGRETALAEQEAARDVEVKRVQYQQDQDVAAAEADKASHVARENANAAINVAAQEAIEAEQSAKRKAEQARYQAEVVVPAEAEKERNVIEAQGTAESERAVAEGKAEAIRLKLLAQAEGEKAIIDSKAKGYENLMAACAAEPSIATTLLVIEKIEHLAGVQVEAMKHMKIDKLVVWEGGGFGGGDKGIASLASDFVRGLPKVHEVAQSFGIELPEIFGSIENGQLNEEEIDGILESISDDDA